MLTHSLQQRTLSDYPRLEAELFAPSNAPLIETPGHHLNIITRECCLSVYGDAWQSGMQLCTNLNAPRVTACSIPGLLPTTLHSVSSGFFIRGEFLRVAYVGNSPDSGYSPGDGKLEQSIEKDLTFLRAKQVIFRLTDVLPSDFSFLGTRNHLAPRGAQYLLDNPALLLEDLSLAKVMSDAGAEVTLLVPHTKDPEEFRLIKEQIACHLPQVRIGLMVETREASRNLDLFQGCEVFFPGPSDLLAELLKISRAEFDGNRARESLMTAICTDFLIGISKLRVDPLIYTIKDMNSRLAIPVGVKRVSIYTAPELYLSAERLAELLKSRSLS